MHRFSDWIARGIARRPVTIALQDYPAGCRVEIRAAARFIDRAFAHATVGTDDQAHADGAARMLGIGGPGIVGSLDPPLHAFGVIRYPATTAAAARCAAAGPGSSTTGPAPCAG